MRDRGTAVGLRRATRGVASDPHERVSGEHPAGRLSVDKVRDHDTHVHHDGPDDHATPCRAAHRRRDGPAVRALQQRLSALGYWLGTPDGTFGASTDQAVYALQKAAGICRDDIVGPLTAAALAAGSVRIRGARRGTSSKSTSKTIS